MSLTKEYLHSVCEIKTMENELVATGILREVTSDYIEIAAKVGRFPIAQYGVSVKINVFNSRCGFKVLVGEVYTSSVQFIRIVNVIALVDYERRHFFRIDTNIKTNMLLPGADSAELPIRINNISLCGVGILTEQQLEQNKTYALRLRLKQKICSLTFRIIRTEETVEQGHYQYGCQFINVRDTDADILCAFIFDRQREQISRQREKE